MCIIVALGSSIPQRAQPFSIRIRFDNLMIIEYSAFWRICITSLAFVGRSIMEIWFRQVREKKVFLWPSYYVIMVEKSITVKECSLSGSNCGSMRLCVNKCIERTYKSDHRPTAPRFGDDRCKSNVRNSFFPIIFWKVWFRPESNGTSNRKWKMIRASAR
jgi:hypothetical protein